MKLNKEYIFNEAYRHYRSHSKMFVYEELGKDLEVTSRSVQAFLNGFSISAKTLYGIQKLLSLDPSKIFILE